MKSEEERKSFMEFLCNDCGHEFVSDIEQCPECDSLNVEMVYEDNSYDDA